MPKRKTQNEIICEFSEAHGNFYDYSKVKYVNSSTKVTVICPVHGEFKIAPSHHKKGVGCRKCYFDSQKLSKEEFILRSQKQFGNRYDYSLFNSLPPDREKVQIKCLEHDVIFFQEPKNHIIGHTGCPKCLSLILSGDKEKRGRIKFQTELNKDFIRRATAIHGDKYDYCQFKYVNSATSGKIICKIHGEFYQSPSNHLRESQCPRCSIEKKKEGTFKQQCNDKGVDYYRALKRRQAGLPDDKVFNEGYIRSERVTNEIEISGKMYPNLEEAVRVLNPSASTKTIARWIDEGMSPEVAFKRIPNPGYANGIIYLITDEVHGKKYVGQTVQEIERRWEYHIEQANSGYIKSEESLHAAIRKYGQGSFSIEIIDKGIAIKDLGSKEREWIKRLNTLVPNGYNISTGGASGGANKKLTIIDGIRFESRKKAAEYVSKTRKISIASAKMRIRKGRIDVKSPSKPGESIIKTKPYKSWSRIIHGTMNPNSKDYILGMAIYEKWKDFDHFYMDVGDPPEQNMAFTRIDKSKGFFPDNCAWMTKNEASKINAKFMKETGRLTGRKPKLPTRLIQPT
jgi:group I intron endonuclease